MKASVEEILKELELIGNSGTKKMLMKNHGIKEPFFGVKIGDMKKLVRRIKVDHELALGLYETGNYDAMYFAGLIADPGAMTKGQLNKWARLAYGGSLPGATVPGVAAESRYGLELALKWIDASKDQISACGWATLSGMVSITPDENLDLELLRQLLSRVENEIHSAGDDTKYQMNQFVISAGGYVKDLTDECLSCASRIGKVVADLGPNQCQLPDATQYIRKMETMGKIGKKRKSARC